MVGLRKSCSEMGVISTKKIVLKCSGTLHAFQSDLKFDCLYTCWIGYFWVACMSLLYSLYVNNH